MTKLREIGANLLLSLGLAFVFWVFVTLSTNPDDNETYNNIPVEVQGRGNELVIVDQDGLPRPDQTRLDPVSVELETDRDTLTEVSQGDISAFVDLSDLGPGTHRVEVEVPPPRNNVRIITVDPEAIPLRLEAIVTRTVPITVDVQGSPPFSYERDEPEVLVNGEPINQVQISGPESLVDRVVVAATAVNIDQLQSTSVSTRQLEPLDANGTLVEGVQVEPEQTSVRVNIRSVVGLKRVPVLGNVIGTPAPGFIITSVRSDPPLINIVGSSQDLAQIDRIETEVIDATGVTSTITQEVDLRFRGAQRASNEPATAIVTVEIAPLNQLFENQVQVPVRVVGLDDGLLLTITPRVIAITVQGSVGAFIEPGALESVEAIVDVRDIGPGVYDLQPEIAAPPNFTVISDVPTVTIELQVPEVPTSRPTNTPTSTSEPSPTTEEPPENTTEPDATTPTPTESTDE